VCLVCRGVCVPGVLWCVSGLLWCVCAWCAAVCVPGVLCVHMSRLFL
jgi:hypothetical protein